MDFPRINYAYNGSTYNFFYGTGLQSTPSCQPTTFKVNVRTKTTLSWHETGCFPSEAIFVSKPGSLEEDDGVVVSVVGTIGADQEDFLLILEAKTMKELARVVFPGVRFPKDQHGVFVPSW